jgi:NTP pyrophosphatase (non-canonical NTP hydrolase)
MAELQADIVENNKAKGWHDDPPDLPAAMMMLVTEAVEAVEAWRAHGTEDATRMNLTGSLTHPSKPEGVGSEFADILIRLLDDCYLFGIDLQAEVERKIAYNRTREYRHGGKRI